ncbi:MAG: PKD domain-containing protein [Chloroflexota bacterium]|nr:PKD domain-containing protein [Chloroflexota bacterium]
MHHVTRTRSQFWFALVALATVLALSLGSLLPAAAQEERTGESKAEFAGVASSTLSVAYNTDGPSLASSLVGTGVTLVGASYAGSWNAAGTFADAGATGVPDGVILSSGDIANVIGPNQSSSITASNGIGGDADLTALSGVSTYDASVLTLDFTADAQTVYFNYVFSSDEYNEYVNSAYNDVFGFFVNGVNCATVNGSPVSINTINNGSNAGSYRDNTSGAIDTEMDGLTVVLSCEAAVEAAPDVNTLKLAIADGSDSVLDSNVFIQGTSLTTTPVNTAPTVTADAYGDCSGAAVDVTITDPDAGDTHTTIVNWGDGTVEDLSALGTAFTATHNYGVAGATYPVTVTVTDAAGAEGSASDNVTINYVITGDGFLPPINNDGSSVFKYKSTIPVKIQVLDCDGLIVNGLAPQIDLVLLSSAAPPVSINEPDSTSAADTTGVMRDAGDHYIYNLATKPLPDPSGIYEIVVTIPETGQQVIVDFGLKN